MPVGFEDSFCRYCGTQGVACGTVVWRLAHVPVECVVFLGLGEFFFP